MPVTGAARRFLALVLAVGTFLFLLSLFSFRDDADALSGAGAGAAGQHSMPGRQHNTQAHTSPGKAIAPKLGNETAK